MDGDELFHTRGSDAQRSVMGDAPLEWARLGTRETRETRAEERTWGRRGATAGEVAGKAKAGEALVRRRQT